MILKCLIYLIDRLTTLLDWIQSVITETCVKYERWNILGKNYFDRIEFFLGEFRKVPSTTTHLLACSTSLIKSQSTKICISELRSHDSFQSSKHHSLYVHLEASWTLVGVAMRSNQSRSRTDIHPDKMMNAKKAQIGTAKKVVIRALRPTTAPEGADLCVPGTTSPTSPWVSRRSGNTMKKVINQTTANRTIADVIAIKLAPIQLDSH